MADVVCIGFACIDVMMRGITVDVKEKKAEIQFDDYLSAIVETDLAVGGDAGNEAICMAKLGVNVQLIAGIGRDVPGRFLSLLAQEQGVDMSRAIVHPTAKTGVYTNLLQEVGERFYLSETTSPSRDFMPDLSAISDAKIVTLGSLFIPPLLNVEKALSIVKAAKSSGAVICADVKQPEVENPLAYYDAVWPYVDFFFPNEIEGRQLTDETHPDKMIDAFLMHGIKTVILKLGQEGCIVATKKTRTRLPALKANVVDTTGAGDAFLAGFCTAYLANESVVDCCKFGSAVSAVVIEAVGATTGLMNRAQINTRLKSAN